MEGKESRIPPPRQTTPAVADSAWPFLFHFADFYFKRHLVGKAAADLVFSSAPVAYSARLAAHFIPADGLCNGTLI